MTTCLGKSCSFGPLSMSFVNVYQSVCSSFPFGFECGMWDLIVYFVKMVYISWMYVIAHIFYPDIEQESLDKVQTKLIIISV